MSLPFSRTAMVGPDPDVEEARPEEAEGPAPRLEDVFDFGADDLRSNREGRLSNPQQVRVAGLLRLRRVMTVVATVFMLVAAGGGLAVLMAVDEVRRSPEARLAVMAVAGLMVLALVAAEAFSRIRSRDLRTGRVRVATGAAETSTRRHVYAPGGRQGRPSWRDDDGSAYYRRMQVFWSHHVSIGDETFQVETEEQRRAFEDGADYHLYYLRRPGLPLILSVEPAGT